MYGTREIHNIKLHWDIVMLETWDVEIFTRKTPNDLVSEGYMEEVKENQKTLDIDKKLTEQFIKNNVACTPCEMWKPNSILEKLRLFLDRKQTDITEIASQYWWSTDLSVKSAILSDIAFFLTSLEQPKEEPQPQEDIELLPKFNREIVEERAMNSHAHQVITLAWISDILVEQVELLTNAVNQLIKANNK